MRSKIPFPSPTIFFLISSLSVLALVVLHPVDAYFSPWVSREAGIYPGVSKLLQIPLNVKRARWLPGSDINLYKNLMFEPGNVDCWAAAERNNLHFTIPGKNDEPGFLNFT